MAFQYEYKTVEILKAGGFRRSGKAYLFNKITVSGLDLCKM